MSSPSLPAFPPTSGRSDSDTSERAMTRAIASDSPRFLELEGDGLGNRAMQVRVHHSLFDQCELPDRFERVHERDHLSANSVRGVTS